MGMRTAAARSSYAGRVQVVTTGGLERRHRRPPHAEVALDGAGHGRRGDDLARQAAVLGVELDHAVHVGRGAADVDDDHVAGTGVLVVEAVRSLLARTDHADVEVVVVHDTPTPDAVLDELRDVARDRRPAGNLVFLVDVSGSMGDPDKLPLVKQALLMLVDELTENDRVAIVAYAGDAGLKLPPTSGDQKERIRAAIESLAAGLKNNASPPQAAGSEGRGRNKRK
jgi:Mg-chelatase subunit ChlD